MGISVATKTITPTSITCKEKAQTTLALNAAPDITTNPVDIMLVLDRSGSMGGTPIAQLKLAAHQFVTIIQEATNPGDPSQIGAPSRIGIVSFADNATLDTAFTRNVNTLNTAIEALVAGGNTNHKEAFELATAQYTPPLTPPNKKIMIMFTDGETTTGGNADPAAAAARAQGIEIYAIGLGSVNPTNLNNWASDPDSTHVLIAPTPADLKQAFEDLAANITKPGATNITVVDTVEDEFEILPPITHIEPSTTTASYTISGKSITWKLDVLGKSTTEAATLSFYVGYLGSTSATLPVNRTVTYTDTEGNQVNFTPNVTEITITCNPTCCEGCDVDTFESIYLDPCEEEVHTPPVEAVVKPNGRRLFVHLHATACQEKDLNVAVLLSEVTRDASGNLIAETPYATKVVRIPATGTTTDNMCHDRECNCVEFAINDDSTTQCGQREFRVRTKAHHVYAQTPTTPCPCTCPITTP